jgi:hypothetical protein
MLARGRERDRGRLVQCPELDASLNLDAEPLRILPERKGAGAVTAVFAPAHVEARSGVSLAPADVGHESAPPEVVATSARHLPTRALRGPVLDFADAETTMAAELVRR